MNLLAKSDNSKSNDNFKVDFIGIGAPKCATSWITACLREHPDVNFSERKETHFFLTSIFGYKNAYGHLKCRSYEDYKGEFLDDTMKIKGEFSTGYLYDPQTPHLIKERFPDVKIIASLRNPVDVLYSRYWFDRPNKRLNFKDTIEKKPILVELGLFYKYLKEYYNVFPRENIHIIIVDDIKKDSIKVLRKLYNFLNIDESFIAPSLDKKANKTTQARFNFITKFSKNIINALKKIGLTKITYKFLNISSNSLLVKLYYLINEKDSSYPPLDNETRIKLKSIYRKDIENLEKLIGRDLSHWK